MKPDTPYTVEELGAVAKEARGTRSQVAVAHELGVFQSQVSRAEAGERGAFQTMKAMIEAFTGYTVAGPFYILRRKGKAEKK